MEQKEDAGKEDAVEGQHQQAKTEAEVVKESDGASFVASESDTRGDHFTRREFHRESSTEYDGRSDEPRDSEADERRASDNALEEETHERIPSTVSDMLKEHNSCIRAAAHEHVKENRNVLQLIDVNVVHQNYHPSHGLHSVEDDELDAGLEQISHNSQALHHGKLQGQSRIVAHATVRTGNHKLEELIHDHSPAYTSGSSVINMGTELSSNPAPAPPRPPSSGLYYPLATVSKKMQLFLRCGSAMLSVIAFAVMLSTNETRVASGSTFHVKFSDFEAYNYLIALNMLSFLYSSGQVIISFQLKHRTLSSPIRKAACIYICDQMLAFLLVSCSSSGATASGLSHNGLHNIWPPACSTWKLWTFCSKADGAIAMSFLASLFVMMSSFLSGYSFAVLWAE